MLSITSLQANRKIHRIPFDIDAIQSVAWHSGIEVVKVPPAKTSRRRPRRGYTGKKNRVFIDRRSCGAKWVNLFL